LSTPVIKYTTGNSAFRPWLVYCARLPRTWNECDTNGLAAATSGL
jgi:hypothetical protein